MRRDRELCESPESELASCPRYSTPASGECTGEGRCSWRYVKRAKTVDADCANDAVVRAVVARDQPCFDALPNPENRSDIGWAECFYAVALNMDRDALLAPFEAAFASEDPDKGGCPDAFDVRRGRTSHD